MLLCPTHKQLLFKNPELPFTNFTNIPAPVFYFPRTKALVLELLAAVCLVRGGHEIILSAFDNFKEVRGAHERAGCLR